jgi:hypothetical protein
MIKTAAQYWASNRPTTCGTRAKLAHVRWHGSLLRGLAGQQPSGLPTQPSRADDPRHRCHALSAVTARRVCPGRRGGVSAEGSPAAAAKEGLRDGHQRNEGRAPRKEGARGAHRGWRSTMRRSGGSVWRCTVGSLPEKGSVVTLASFESYEEGRER